jgi:hypothetical protein
VFSESGLFHPIDPQVKLHPDFIGEAWSTRKESCPYFRKASCSYVPVSFGCDLFLNVIARLVIQKLKSM